jgi:hypothetical protein
MKIPNYNTISTLIDRLSIENVKLSHFQYLLENQAKDSNLVNKIKVQTEIIELLKKELAINLEVIMSDKKYEYLSEERTFE